MTRRNTLIGRTLVLAVALAMLVAGTAIAGGATLSAVSGKIGSARSTIVVSSSGRAVYTLTGDSTRHAECGSSNGCWSVWPPVTVRKGQKPTASGVGGTLSVWSHSGINQVLQNGHPLYTYAGDSSAHVATGNGIKTFGGTWFAVK